MNMEKPAIAGGTPVRDTKLFYGHQYIDEADVKAVTEVLTSDYLTCGPKVTELERKLCELTGAKYAVVCSNGTAALHIAAMAAGVSEGDELITTPITFAASANCGLYCGAKPVFADIKFYDTLPVWAAVQSFVCIVMTVLLALHFSKGDKNEKTFSLFGMLPMIAFVVDVAGVGFGLWQYGVISEVVFILIH